MKDILGQALWDYYYDLKPSKLWIHNKYGRKEEMPVEVYFRTEEDLPELEIEALRHCKGKILDIGAGAGSHALLLQQKWEVTALEISAKAAQIMTIRGVKKVVHTDVFQFAEEKFDTLLLLMNGVGLTGTLERLREFLQHAKTLLTGTGQLLFDSSDVAYLYKAQLPKPDNYYGEISYHMNTRNKGANGLNGYMLTS